VYHTKISCTDRQTCIQDQKCETKSEELETKIKTATVGLDTTVPLYNTILFHIPFSFWPYICIWPKLHEI